MRFERQYFQNQSQFLFILFHRDIFLKQWIVWAGIIGPYETKKLYIAYVGISFLLSFRQHIFQQPVEDCFLQGKLFFYHIDLV